MDHRLVAVVGLGILAHNLFHKMMMVVFTYLQQAAIVKITTGTQRYFLSIFYISKTGGPNDIFSF